MAPMAVSVHDFESRLGAARRGPWRVRFTDLQIGNVIRSRIEFAITAKGRLRHDYAARAAKRSSCNFRRHDRRFIRGEPAANSLEAVLLDRLNL